MNDVKKAMQDSVIVPVVVIEDAKDAIPCAKALLAGGIKVMEITLRTEACIESIKAVSTACPDMVVGVGTAVNVAKAKEAVAAGARFVVSPGFDEEIVKYCVDNDVVVCPGCVTPTEIMAALKYDLKVLKFFPANVYGGLNAIKNLAGPFGGIQFIPTGGVNDDNIAEFVESPSVFAIGGSWICKKDDISAGNFEKITESCKKARAASKKA